MEKDLESESDHKARPRGERRRDLRERIRSSRSEPIFLFVIFVVSIYIVDSVNYIGLYIQLVMYDFDVQFCTFLRLCDFVGFCGILWDFGVFCSSANNVVRRIT